MKLQFLTRDEPPFGFIPDLEVNGRRQRSATSGGSRRDVLRHLNRALKASPDQLETLVALYKFHFYRGKLDDAEDVVFQTLVKASSLGHFSNDWNQLDADSSDWANPRGPGRVYLHGLKALAFIRMRQNMHLDADKILRALRRLDPDDRVGADVLRDMLVTLHGR